MPNGTCDPASRGATVNEGSQTFGPNGLLSWQYGWDGVSVRPDCVGNLVSVTATNGNAETWYAHFQGRRGTWKRIAMAPGFNQSFTRNQLRQQGFNDNTDLEGLYLTTDANPPATVAKVL